MLFCWLRPRFRGARPGRRAPLRFPGERSRCVPCCRGFSVRCPKTARRCGRLPPARTDRRISSPERMRSPCQRQHPFGPCERAGSRRGGEEYTKSYVVRDLDGTRQALYPCRVEYDEEGNVSQVTETGVPLYLTIGKTYEFPGHVAGQTSGGNGRRHQAVSVNHKEYLMATGRPLSEFGENGRPPRRGRRRGSLCETEAVGAPDLPA